MRRARRLTAVVAAVVAVAFLAACQDELTPDGSPYGVVVNGAAFTVTNTGSSGPNEREAFIPSGLPAEAASTYTATWTSGVAGQDAQNGVVFRGVDDPTNNNVWDGVVLERSFFENPAGYFILVYFHDGSFTTGTPMVLPDDGAWPLSISASISADDVITFTVNGGPVNTVTADATMTPATGQTGTYFAHVPTGGSMTVTGVTIDGAASPSPTS